MREETPDLRDEARDDGEEGRPADVRVHRYQNLARLQVVSESGCLSVRSLLEGDCHPRPSLHDTLTDRRPPQTDSALRGSQRRRNNLLSIPPAVSHRLDSPEDRVRKALRILLREETASTVSSRNVSGGESPCKEPRCRVSTQRQLLYLAEGEEEEEILIGQDPLHAWSIIV